MNNGLLRGIVGIAGLLACSIAFATPEGAQVSAGSATVTQSGTTTTINQASQNAVINWTSFNTAQSESVQFNQPNSSSIALNKINSGLPTTFNGSLSANGHVWIINPNGVLFGATSQVNVAGLLVTTHNITDSNFMSGHYQFDAVPGYENSKIINNGSITVQDTGMVALVAPGVENNGIITANLGQVHLRSGSSFVLDLYGDQLINFQASPAVQNGYVSNSGKITANGGKVYMTANSAAQAVQEVVSMSGVIEASAVSVNKKGEIILHGGNSGVTRVAGKLKASGGGHIETSGHTVIIESTAEIDAGAGGSWLMDPYDITIVAGTGCTNITCVGNVGAPSGTSTIGVDTIAAILSAGTSVTLDTGNGASPGTDAGDINFNATRTIAMPNNVFATLTLNAFHDININSLLAFNDTGFTLTAGNHINLNASISAARDIVLTSGAGVIVNGNIALSVSQQSPSHLGFGVTINGTIDDIVAHQHSLTVSGAVAPIFTGAVGGTTPFQSLTIQYPFLTVDPTLASFVADQLNNKGTNVSLGVNYGGPANVVQGNLTVSSAITETTGTASLSLTGGSQNGGSIIINAPITLSGGSFTASAVSTGGITSLGADVSAAGGETYNGPVVLTTGPITLTSSAGNITFNGTIDGGFSLTARAMASGKAVIFNGVVGGSSALANLTLNDNSALGSVNINTTNIQTINSQVYNGALVLGGGALSTTITLTSIGGVPPSNIEFGNITINGTIDGDGVAPRNLVLNANESASYVFLYPLRGGVLLNGMIGGITPLASLSATSYLTIINTPLIKTTGTQNYYRTPTSIFDLQGGVMLEQSTTLQSVANANISFYGDVSRRTSPVDLHAGLTILGNLDLHSSSISTIGLSTGGAGDGSAFAWAAPYDLFVSGTTFFGGLGVIATAHDQTYVGPVIVSSPGRNPGFPFLTITVPATINAFSGKIWFKDTIQSNGVVAYDLSIINAGAPGADAIQFDGQIGTSTTFSLTNINSLTVQSFSPYVLIPLSGNIVINTGVINTNGSQTYTGFVTLFRDTVLTSVNSGINFSSTVSSDALITPRALTLVSPSPVTLAGNIGSPIILSALTIGSPTVHTEADINTNLISTVSDQTYYGPVVLGNDVTLSLSAGTLTFDGVVSGAHNLIIDPPAIVQINADINTTSLNITATSAININTANIQTSANQDYNGPVVLQFNPGSTLTSTAGNIAFNGNVEGDGVLGRNMVVNAAGQVSFGTNGSGADVGNSVPLASLDVTSGVATLPFTFPASGNGIYLYTTVMKTTGTQEYHTGVSENASTTFITTGGGNIIFDAILSNSSTGIGTTHTIISSAGNVQFNAGVGALGLNLVGSSTIEVTGATGILINSSTMFSQYGAQLYHSQITLQTNVLFREVNSTAATKFIFDGAIVPLNAGVQTLTINNLDNNNNRDGELTFNNFVGTSALPLGSINIALQGSKITFNSDLHSAGVVTINSSWVSSTGGDNSITFGSGSTLYAGGAVNITSSNIGSNTYVQFNGSLGTSLSPLSSLNVTAGNQGITFGSTANPEVFVTNAETYTGDVIINGVTPQLKFDGTSVTFNNAVNSPSATAVVIPGNLILTANTGSMGQTNPLGSLSVTGTSSIGGNITTANNQIYTGPVTLTHADSLISNAGNILFSNTVNGAFALITSSLSGITTFANTVGATTALASLTTSGTVDINGGSVRTSTFQNYQNAVVLGATTTLSSTGGGALTFATIDSDSNATPRGLTLTTTGLTTLGNNVGITHLLNSLTVTNGVAIGGNIHTVNNQLYSGVATLIANPATPALTTLTSDSGDITFSSTLNGGFNLALNAVGVTFNGLVGNSTPLASLNVVSGVNNIVINTPAVTTSGTQHYSGTVGGVILPIAGLTTLTGSVLTFDVTATAGSTTSDLTIAGALVLNANFSTAFSFGLINNLIVTGSTTINNSATPWISTKLNQTYQGPVLLNTVNSTNLGSTSGNITFNSTIDGASPLLIALSSASGVATFNGVVGGTTPLTQLTVNGSSSATTNINTTQIKTTGTQSYGNKVVVGGGVSAVLTSTTAGMTFGSTVDALTTGGESLQLIAAIPVTLSGNIGSIHPFSALTIGSTGIGGVATQANINTPIVTTTTSQSYYGPVVLGNNATLQTTGTGAGTFILFNNTVSGNFNLIVDPALIIYNMPVNVASLTSTATQIDINTGSIHTTNNQTYNGAVVLGANVNSPGLVSDSGSIAFHGTLDGAFNLTVDAVSGVSQFDGAVGQSLPALTSLTVIGTSNIIINGGVVTTSGAQSYNNGTGTSSTITFGQNTTLNGSTITLGQRVRSALLPVDLTINGNAIFQDQWGLTPLIHNLLVNGTLTFTSPLSGNGVITTGSQTYNSTVTLDAQADFDSQGINQTIWFKGPILTDGTGAQNLNVGTTFSIPLLVEFDGKIGSSTNASNFNINNLSVRGAAINIKNPVPALNGGIIDTNGSQTYTGPVTLFTDTVMTSVNSGMSFSSTVDALTTGGESLQLISPNTITLTGNIGSINPLSILTIGSGSVATPATVVAASIVTTNGQHYFGPVTITTNSKKFTSPTGIIEFDQGISGPLFGVNIDPTTVILAGTYNVAFLTVAASSEIDLRQVTATTSAGETFTAPSIVLQVGDTSLTDSGSSIVFNGAIDGGFNLTVSAPVAFGNVSFNGIVGGSDPLASLMVTAGNATNGQINIGTSQISTIGTQTYFARQTALQNQTSVTLSGSTITFDGPVPPAFVYKVSATPTDLIINGNLDLNAVMNNSAPNRLNGIFVSGSTTFEPTISGAQSSVGDQTYIGPVTSVSGQNVAIVSDSGNVVFGSTINTGGFFVANAQGGSVGVTYNGNVSVGTLWTVGTANINTPTLTANTGDMRFFNAVKLLQDATLQSTLNNILFAGTVDGGFKLTTTGTTTFDGIVGGTQPLDSILINTLTKINTTLIKTANGQTYTGNVTVTNASNPTNLNFWSVNGGDITFDNFLATGVSPVVNVTITGNLVLGPLGNIATVINPSPAVYINSLTVTGTTSLNATSYLGGAFIFTQQNQTYNDKVTLGVDSRFLTQNGTITFVNTLEGPFNAQVQLVTSSAVANFNGAVGGVGAANPLASLTVLGFDAAPSTVNVNTSEINTTGDQTYTNLAMKLVQDTVWTSSAGGFNFNTGTLIDSDTPVVLNAHALTLVSLNPVSLTGNIGSINKLKSLTIGSNTVPTEADINTLLINTTTSQLYNGPVILGTTAQLTTTNAGGVITFGSTVDGAFNLTVSSDNITFAGNVGAGTPLNLLILPNGLGTITLNPNHLSNFSINTASQILFQGNVILAGDVASPDGIAPGGLNAPFFIGIGGTLDGGSGTTSAYSLTAKTTELEFASTVKINALHVFSGNTLFDGNVFTTTTQTYDGSVQYGIDNFVMTGTTITFNGTLDFHGENSGSIAINASTAVSFNGDVGAATFPPQITTLTVTSPQITIGAANVTTINEQTYNGPVTLSVGETTLTGTTINFERPVNSTVGTPTALTIQGNLFVAPGPTASIGLTNPVQSIFVSGTTIGPNTSSIGDQTYVGPVLMNSDETYTSSTGNIFFQSTIDNFDNLGPYNLITNTTGSNSTYFDDNIGSGSFGPLGSVTVNGKSVIGFSGSNVTITTVGDQIYNDIMTLDKDLTTIATGAGRIEFGHELPLPVGGVFGPTHNLIAVSNNAAFGPTGSGITGIVNVNSLTVGGPGGANLSVTYPSTESFVMGQGAQQAFANTLIAPDFRPLGAVYCVNNLCTLIPVPPTPIDNIPNNIPPTQIFSIPKDSSCDASGCDNLELIQERNNCAYSDIQLIDGNDKAKRNILLKQEENCSCKADNKWMKYCKTPLRNIIVNPHKSAVGILTKAHKSDFMPHRTFIDVLKTMMEHR